MEFHQSSAVIPVVYLRNASKIPLEYCFKIPVFFLEGMTEKLNSTFTEEYKTDMNMTEKLSHTFTIEH